MNSGYKLKWLNGLLAGRELDLPAGEIRLGGSGADVAVTLEDGHEAMLLVDEGGVKLNSQAPVWVDGNRWESDERLPLHLPVDIAGQAFVLGVAVDTLAHPPVPSRRGPTSPTKREERQERRQLTTPRVLGICVAAVAVIGCVVAALVLSKPARETTPSRPKSSFVERLQKRLPHGTKIAEDSSGMVVVSGYCTDSAEIDRLRQQLQQAGRLVRDDTVCADVLRHSVRVVLDSNGYEDVDISDGPAPGTIVIRGAFASDAQWHSTIDQLRTIPGLKHWSIESDRAASFEKLMRMLAGHDLLDGTSVSVVGRWLVVSGAASPHRTRMIEDVISRYNDSGAGMRARLEEIAASTSTADLLPAAIESVGGNADGLFVGLENGMRLTRGAVLPNGFTVFSVSRSFMELRRAERLVAVPLGL